MSDSATSQRLLAQLQPRLRKTLPDARIEISALPGLPEITLGLINADYQTGPLPGEVMHAVIANPAYWAFCWGSGIALARWILDHPETVRDQRVIDLGPGSGVVAIAASLAGAREVCACDNDPDALAATRINAELNGVQLTFASDLALLDGDHDVLFMADVLYDRANFGLIDIAKKKAHQIIIADSRVADVEDETFILTHADCALTIPNLGEFDEFRDVRFFRWGGY